MVRRSFRVGLRLGLLIGIGFAVFKTVQSRRSASPAVPPPEPWQPLVDTTRPAPSAKPVPPVDEVGEPVMEPAAPEPAPEPDDITMTGSIEEDLLIEDAELSTPESALDVVPDDAPAPPKNAAAKKAPAKKAPAAPAAKAAPTAKKAEPAKKAAKKAAKSPQRSGEAAPPGAPTKKAPVEPFISAWVQPEGGVCPPSHPVKAKLASRLFHLPGMFAYDRTRPDRCFRDAEAATAEGFTQAKR